MLHNQKKEIIVYQNGKYIDTFKTIKETCEYCKIANYTFNNYMQGNFKNRNGFTFEYKDASLQEFINQKNIESTKLSKRLQRTIDAEKRLQKIHNSDWYKKLKNEIILKLLDYCIIQYGKKQKWYMLRLNRWYCLSTLRIALNKFEDENSQIYSFKDFELFDKIENRKFYD